MHVIKQHTISIAPSIRTMLELERCSLHASVRAVVVGEPSFHSRTAFSEADVGETVEIKNNEVRVTGTVSNCCMGGGGELQRGDRDRCEACGLKGQGR